MPAGTRGAGTRSGARIDLGDLQARIRSGALSEYDVWVATTSCERDLQNYRWTYDDVLKMLAALGDGDYRKSQLCKITGGHEMLCDAYVLPWDSERRARTNTGLEVYLKFSLDDEARLTLVLVSCHGSR